MKSPGKAHFSIVIGIAAVVAAVLAVRYFFDVQHNLNVFLGWIKNLGAWAPLFFILLYVLTTILFIPGFVLTLGAGILFGVVPGTVTVSIAATLGATAAFIIGRHFARDWVSRQVRGRPKVDAVDAAVGREGWKIVLLTRLSPIFPFNVLNYAFGLTRISLGGYFLASWIGMLPGTIMYVYIGSLIGNLALLGTEQRSRTTMEWLFYAAGLAIAALVAVYVTRLARRALQEKVGSEKQAVS